MERKRRLPVAASALPAPLLEGELEAACARGRAGNPGLVVDDTTFAEHLARVSKSGAPTSLTDIAVEDLFLACACLVKAPGAAAELGRRHGATIRGSIGRMVPGPDIAEIEQQLLDGLLVGSSSSPPKIGTYAGQAPLDRWLQVSAQRAALMWLRARRADLRAREGAAAQPRSAPTHPEIAYLKERYRADFEQALHDALGRLADRDRAVLRLHLVSGLTVDSVGKMFGISQASASRWLAKARKALLDDIKATLRARIGASSEEVASLAGLVASDLDVSLSQLLQTR